MKKLMIALSLAALVSGVANASETEIIVDSTESAVNHNLPLITSGEIKFTGSVYSKTCSIKNGAVKNISLPEVSNDDFEKGTYGTAGSKSFDIELENCTTGQDKLVTLQFNPTENSVVEGFLKNKAVNGSNVLIRLDDANGRKIDLQAATDTGPISVGEVGEVIPVSLKAHGIVAYKLSVSYAKDGDKHITPGNVEAMLPFTIAYK